MDVLVEFVGSRSNHSRDVRAVRFVIDDASGCLSHKAERHIGVLPKNTSADRRIRRTISERQLRQKDHYTTKHLVTLTDRLMAISCLHERLRAAYHDELRLSIYI